VNYIPNGKNYVLASVGLIEFFFTRDGKICLFYSVLQFCKDLDESGIICIDAQFLLTKLIRAIYR